MIPQETYFEALGIVIVAGVFTLLAHIYGASDLSTYGTALFGVGVGWLGGAARAK